VIVVQIGEVCFCKQDIISVCSAGGQEQQKNCRFYQKSSYKNACMYFVFDAYCDSVEAQSKTKCAA
jgi:hypothetical protein